MAKKRGSGEGTVFQRADGRWVGRLSLGFCEKTGKRVQKTVYGSSQAHVIQKLEELRQQRRQGGKAIASKDSVAGYLKRWLEDYVLLNRAGKTHQEYELATRLYIEPFIGSVKLTNLDSDTLTTWQGKLARQEFTPNMRHRSIKVLRSALTRAVKMRLIPFNPCKGLELPTLTPKEVVPLEPEQCHKLFESCQKHRLGDLIVLAAMTGLRRGELFALEWSAVNITEGVLVVRRTLEELSKLKVKRPKTKASRRVVTLGSEAVAALERRRDKAIEEGFDTETVPLVFPDTRGGYLRGSNFARNVWYPIREAAGIPETFVFHDLRHTQASLMVAAGIDLKVVQVRLGHRDFATTANVYSHLLQGVQAEAMQKVDDLLRRTAPKVEQPAEKAF
ncbi:MAG: tyrosine-type recombinase/integrase [Planctomycetaceae bacterium]